MAPKESIYPLKFFTEGVKPYMPKNEIPLEELYGIVSKKLPLTRVTTSKTKKYLDIFKSPGPVLIDTEFPEFTSLCPKTNQPDFGCIRLVYIPDLWCVELKSLKYYLNSFRNEGHFHEEVTKLICDDLRGALAPVKIQVIGEFNYRGGLTTTVHAGDSIV